MWGYANYSAPSHLGSDREGQEKGRQEKEESRQEEENLGKQFYHRDVTHVVIAQNNIFNFWLSSTTLPHVVIIHHHHLFNPWLSSTPIH